MITLLLKQNFLLLVRPSGMMGQVISSSPPIICESSRGWVEGRWGFGDLSPAAGTS